MPNVTLSTQYAELHDLIESHAAFEVAANQQWELRQKLIEKHQKEMAQVIARYDSAVKSMQKIDAAIKQYVINSQSQHLAKHYGSPRLNY